MKESIPPDLQWLQMHTIGFIKTEMNKLIFHFSKCLFYTMCLCNNFTLLIFREGEEWRKSRSKLGKQLLPANVLGYCPGFNKISDRMIRNIQDTQDKDGYVEDIRTPITHWSLEGIFIVCV